MVLNMLKYSKSFKNIVKRYSTSVPSKKPVIKWPKRVFSGIQPTGTVHIGNYFGAIRNWVDMQNSGDDVILSIVDLHSITLPQDPKKLSESIKLMTATLLACGVNPSKSILFQQSKVPQHVLFGWVLGTLTTMTRLYHFPQYKEKSSTIKDIPLGLFTYPVLQAADILLYKSTHVPVGEDQVQHLNLAQHLVHTFNNRFGVTFPQPVSIVDEKLGGRIKNLKEPEKKMSKSHQNAKSRIEVTDAPNVIVDKIKKALTDFVSEVTYDPVTRPGVANLIDIHALLTGKTPQDICKEYSNVDTGKYKLIVADALVDKISPIRDEILRILDSPEYIQSVLENGNERALKIAEKTWDEVTHKIGLDISQKFEMKLSVGN